MRTWIIFTWIISCCLGSQALGKKAAHTEESWLGKLTPEAQKLIKNSRWIGQGNPRPTKHPMTRQECQNKLKKLNVSYDNPKFEKICGATYMAPLYNPKKETITDATTCIDQFEFPNQPCEYPIVWVRAKEATEICNAMGKRICDAHEWEGACEGRLLAPDYDFSLGKPTDANIVKRRRLAHNKKNEKTWAMGKKWQKGQCATGGSKSKGCNGGNWQKCGSNTFPSGSFPKCKSQLEVYDQHGNAAEHMNLPLTETQMASNNKQVLGVTEMKGSWFVFDKIYAHQDYCRWRAPYWHGTKVLHKKSHHNYHLGFRCCKNIQR